MHILRALTATCTTLAAVITLGACSTNNGSDITVYSGRSEHLVQPLIDQFEEETGITVNVRYGETSAMAAQIMEEGDRTPADVFLAQDAGALGAVTKKGLFTPLPEETANLVPEEYRGANNAWIGVTGRARVIVYNPEKVSEDELPSSVYELIEDKWKGRVGIAPTNGSFQAFITAIRVAEGDEKAREFLTGLHNNDVQIRERNGIILDDVDAGQIDLGLINHYYWFEKQKEVGAGNMNAQLHFVGNGDPGALVNVSGVGVLTHAEGDSDVEEFISYLLSDDGQRYFAEETSEYPLTDAVAPAEGLPNIEELNPPAIDLDDLDSLETTVRFISESGLTS